METLALSIGEKYGIFGFIAVAVGFVAWYIIKDRIDSKKIISSTSSTADTLGSKIDKITESIKNIQTDITNRQTSIINKIDNVNTKIDNLDGRVSSLEHGQHDIPEGDEYLSLIKQLQISVPINKAVNDLRLLLNADHTFFCSMHNHNEDIQGIPYLKFTCLCDKYNPLDHLMDIDLTRDWKDINIFSHGNLFPILYQNNVAEFYSNSEDHKKNIEVLDEIDDLLYRLVRHIGIKRIIFKGLLTEKNELFGFIGAYSFSEGEPFNIIELNNIASQIECHFNKIK